MALAADTSTEVILGLIATTQVLVHAVVKLGEWAITRRKSDCPSEPTKGIGEAIATIHGHTTEIRTMLQTKDSDGRPVWWFPPRMLELAEKQLEALKEISVTQKVIIAYMKKPNGGSHHGLLEDD